MTELIACCGLVCHTCPIYLATREENREEQTRMRLEIARLCREQYGMDLQPEDITDCDGCAADGRLFSKSRDCAVRNCSKSKSMKNCAWCPAYACEKLEAFFAKEPTAKPSLDHIRNQIRGEG